MISSYLIDTDTVSFAIQGDERIRRRWKFIAPEEVFISSVAAAELLYSLKKLSSSHPLSVEVAAFLRSANILAWGIAAAEAYAGIRHTLTASGQLIGELDRMIAAHALARASMLVTNNTRHFERLAPPLQLENWATSG